jgi:malonate transporter and related proteins
MSTAWLVLPDFLLIMLGWVLHHRLGFSREFFSGLEKLVYYVLFPALLFQSILKTPLAPSTAADLLIAAATLIVVGYVLARMGGRLLKVPDLALASCTQCGFRFNTYLGLALAPSLAGASGQTIMALIVGLSVPMANIAAVYPLAKHQGGNFFSALLRNPLFISTVLGLAGNLAGFELPIPLDTLANRLGMAAIALGILCIGPSLSWQGSQLTGFVAWMVSTKIVVLPIVAWICAAILQLDALTTQMLVLFATLPCSSAAYVLAVRMGGDGRLVSLIISVSTLISAVTIPLWMNILI